MVELHPLTVQMLGELFFKSNQFQLKIDTKSEMHRPYDRIMGHHYCW